MLCVAAMIVRCLFLLLALLAASRAGEPSPDPGGGRRQFRESTTYPYVFEPVHYLEQGPPKPLRFGEKANDCARHNPPALPPEAKKDKAVPPSVSVPALTQPFAAALPPETKAQPAPPPSPEAKPAPEHAPESKPAVPPAAPEQVPEALDTSKYPDEVVDYFKNPYNVPKSRKHFFDTIFEPAAAPTPDASKATYRQE
jgi:hypothetical protein